MIGFCSHIRDVKGIFAGQLLFQLQIPLLNLTVLVVLVHRVDAQTLGRSRRIEVWKSWRRKRIGNTDGTHSATVEASSLRGLSGEGNAKPVLRQVTHAAAKGWLLTQLVADPAVVWEIVDSVPAA